MFHKLLSFMFPHLFLKEKIPQITDEDLKQKISELRSSASLNDAMASALRILSSKYQSQRIGTYLYFYKSYEKDPNKLWKRRGFMHCTQQNYLCRVLLVKSGWLKDAQISYGYSLVWYFSPHQYLRVTLPNRKIAIDPWNYIRGVPLGNYAVGFGSKPI